MKGKITKLQAYPSGKGYFIGIDNKTPDFMFRGNPNVKIGEFVEFETGAPFNGKPTIKTMRLDSIEAYEAPARDEDRAKATPVFRAHEAPKDSREEYWKAKEKRDLEAKPIEIRLSCIASAVLLYKASETPAEIVIGAAKKFEAYANGKQ
jgi:hypothetical protein